MQNKELRMKGEDLLKIFNKFLHKNDAYEKYWSNVLASNKNLSHSNMDRAIVECGFRWGHTEEGVHYWNLIDDLWQSVVFELDLYEFNWNDVFLLGLGQYNLEKYPNLSLDKHYSDEVKSFIQQVAYEHRLSHDYLPQSYPELFEPHEWVIDAVQRKENKIKELEQELDKNNQSSQQMYKLNISFIITLSYKGE